MKKFLLPLQNMVQADLFSGSLAVWKDCSEAATLAILRRAERNEGRSGKFLYKFQLAERVGFEPTNL